MDTLGRSRVTRLQIPRSAARILQYAIGNVNGEAGTQLPHCLSATSLRAWRKRTGCDLGDAESKIRPRDEAMLISVKPLSWPFISFWDSVTRDLPEPQARGARA
jgi:hypothetical protein